MSAKNVDKHNCFRSITVGFRVSPEEQEELNRVVALSGLCLLYTSGSRSIKSLYQGGRAVFGKRKPSFFPIA